MFFIVPTFEENGIFIIGVVFLFGQFSPIETIVFNKQFLYPIEDNEFLSSNSKSYFTSNCFVQSSGGLKVAKLAMFWIQLCALWWVFSQCWECNANNLCVANYLAQQNRSKLNWGLLIGRGNFVRLKLIHSDVVQKLRTPLFRNSAPCRPKGSLLCTSLRNPFLATDN